MFFGGGQSVFFHSERTEVGSSVQEQLVDGYDTWRLCSHTLRLQVYSTLIFPVCVQYSLSYSCFRLLLGTLLLAGLLLWVHPGFQGHIYTVAWALTANIGWQESLLGITDR